MPKIFINAVDKCLRLISLCNKDLSKWDFSTESTSIGITNNQTNTPFVQSHNQICGKTICDCANVYSFGYV